MHSQYDVDVVRNSFLCVFTAKKRRDIGEKKSIIMKLSAVRPYSTIVHNNSTNEGLNVRPHLSKLYIAHERELIQNSCKKFSCITLTSRRVLDSFRQGERKFERHLTHFLVFVQVEGHLIGTCEVN